MSKSNVYCCVPQCYSLSKRDPELSFHRFPHKGAQRVYVENTFGEKQLMDRRRAWILRLKFGKTVTKSMSVCSRHFRPDDYFGFDTKIKKYLKKTAVPSLNLPETSHDTRKLVSEASSSRNKRLQDRRLRKQTPIARAESSPIDSSHTLIDTDEKKLQCQLDAEEQNEPSAADIAAAESLLLLLTTQPDYCGPTKLSDLDAATQNVDAGVSKEISTRDVGVQVNTPKKFTICDVIKTDSVLNSFTGLNSFTMLDVIVENLIAGLIDTRLHILSVKERVVLCFIKLKHNLTYVVLSSLFGISYKLCKIYIHSMLPNLAEVLHVAIPFPTADEIKQNLPVCFENFANVRVVLDCTEIYVQKPKCLCCRIKFYSHYKSSETVKFMTGVSPGGLITFISKPYGGRASDKQIFEQSDILPKLQKSQDAIMVDKGFLIDDICERFDIKLIRPPFLRQQKQLTAEDVK